ncbi:metallophosphoesterase family protein [Sporobolomyces salmoneus]|uniref:metallophosphoesterase family protein n=1 Tax=Sporobolomyces salmoneus TaxID=183962 RepID=UPI00317AAC93
MSAYRSGVNPIDLSHLRSRSRSRTPSNSNPPSPALDSPMIPHSPLLHSASASSAAGEASFIAFPPPKPDIPTKSQSTPTSHSRSRSLYDDEELSPPERPHRSLHPPSSIRPCIGLPNVFRRRKRLLIAFLSTLVVLSILRRLFAPTLLLIRFKFVDYAYSENWGFPLAQRECGFRKEPMIFVKGDEEVSIVWEIGKCPLGKDEWNLRWRKEEDSSKEEGEVEWNQVAQSTRSDMELDYDGGSLRSVYSTTLDRLQGGSMYRYQILKSQKVVRSYSFPFLGSSSSPTPSPPQTLHIACVADNQFNLRTFHSILFRLLSSSRSLSTRFTPSNFPKRRPHLVLHAGDNVQNPHDLQQWQTDFWDPLTKELRYNLGSQVPILLARGNHDWDKTGKNVYVGGLPPREEWTQKLELEGREQGVTDLKKGSMEGKRGTFYSFSPHKRVRILVLDSNLLTEAEQKLQEEWLEWEVSREEWTRASLRIVVVHTAPWIEWWNRRAWTDGKEWKWSLFVRQRLVPILVNAKCTLLLSGHSHSYSRGFLPYSLSPSFTSETQSLNSQSLPSFAVASIKERSWEKRSPSRSTGVIEEPGLISIVYGGAGGTLDTEKVEDWGLFERGKWDQKGKYHFGMMSLHLAGDDGAQLGRTFTREDGKKGTMKRDWKNEAEWIYRAEALEDEKTCESRGQRLVEEWIEWRAVDIDGGTRDRIGIVGTACA